MPRLVVSVAEGVSFLSAAIKWSTFSRHESESPCSENLAVAIGSEAEDEQSQMQSAS